MADHGGDGAQNGPVPWKPMRVPEEREREN